MTTDANSQRGLALRKRLPLLLAIALGVVVWRNGFGLFATPRRVEWRLPVAYSELQRVELQLWQGESLLKREEHTFVNGVSEALECSVPLTRGVHRALATATLRDGRSKTFSTEFDPQSDPTIVVDFRPRR